MIHSKLSLRHILCSVISLWEMSRQWSTVCKPEMVPFIWQAWCGLWSLGIFPTRWNCGFPEKYYFGGTSLKAREFLPLSHRACKPNQSAKPWLKRGVLGLCHKSILHMGENKELMVMVPVLITYYGLGTPVTTLYLQNEPSCSCRSQAGSNR